MIKKQSLGFLNGKQNNPFEKQKLTWKKKDLDENNKVEVKKNDEAC
jgi:hypothetical protein